MAVVHRRFLLVKVPQSDVFGYWSALDRKDLVAEEIHIYAASMALGIEKFS